MAGVLADGLIKSVEACKNRPYFLAISGGSTPGILYKELAGAKVAGQLDWDRIQLFWVDERCVPWESSESNYGTTLNQMIKHVPIPLANVHPMFQVELGPYESCRRYAAILKEMLPQNPEGFPRFDEILLGIGTDGHTASIFPSTPGRKAHETFTIVTEHPESGQKRISLDFPVINAAETVKFLVTGPSKAQVVQAVLSAGETNVYPASMVRPVNGKLEWHLDSSAAGRLDQNIISS